MSAGMYDDDKAVSFIPKTPEPERPHIDPKAKISSKLARALQARVMEAIDASKHGNPVKSRTLLWELWTDLDQLVKSKQR